MKKLLLAATALVALSGSAYAQGIPPQAFGILQGLMGGMIPPPRNAPRYAPPVYSAPEQAQVVRPPQPPRLVTEHPMVNSGAWTAVSGVYEKTSEPFCTMKTQLQGGAMVFVVYTHPGEDRVGVQMTSPDWRFAPWEIAKEKTIEVYFDNDLFTTIAGKPTMETPAEGGRGFIKFQLGDKADVPRFVEQFAASSWMWLRWDNNSFSVDMTGSRPVSEAFKSCIVDLKTRANPWDKS
jgi:hypothetical protein